MSVHLEVLVQLPDGSTQYLPIAVYSDSGRGTEIRQFGTRKEARSWAEFILPEKLRLSEK